MLCNRCLLLAGPLVIKSSGKIAELEKLAYQELLQQQVGARCPVKGQGPGRKMAVVLTGALSSVVPRGALLPAPPCPSTQHCCPPLPTTTSAHRKCRPSPQPLPARRST